MGKRIECSDVGMDCDFAAFADTEEELMELTTEHARRVHDIEEFTPELEEKIRSAIQDV